MLKNLSTCKRWEYRRLCDEIWELSQEIDRARKENKDTTELNVQLEAATKRCMVFVQEELRKGKRKMC